MRYIKKIIFLVLIIIACGCISQISSDLPSVSGWEKSEISVEQEEEISIKEGVYKNGEKGIILFLYSGNDENTIKNTIEGKAYEYIIKPEQTGGGMVNEKEAYIMKTTNMIAMYFNNGNVGYVVISDKKENIQEFLTAVFGSVYISI